jgi:hypothetical protein
MRIAVALVFALTGCDLADKNTCDDLQRPATWTFTLGEGKLGETSFAGRCPSFAPRVLHIPDDGTGCDPGCSCQFFASENNTGDVTPHWDCGLAFFQTCADRSTLDCSYDPLSNDRFCTWYSGAIQPPTPGGDCSYTFSISRS